MRADQHVVLPDEDAGEFAALEAALIAELAPVGTLQILLAGRVAVAAWRLARADRMETEVLEEHGYGNASPGLAPIRDGNGTRSLETLLRYRGAAMTEFWRARRTLKALQAEQALATGPALDTHAPAARPAPARRPLADRPEPDEPEGGPSRRLCHVTPEQPGPGRTLHEPAAAWTPNEPEPERLPGAAAEKRPGLPATKMAFERA